MGCKLEENPRPVVKRSLGVAGRREEVLEMGMAWDPTIPLSGRDDFTHQTVPATVEMATILERTAGSIVDFGFLGWIYPEFLEQSYEIGWELGIRWRVGLRNSGTTCSRRTQPRPAGSFHRPPLLPFGQSESSGRRCGSQSLPVRAIPLESAPETLFEGELRIMPQFRNRRGGIGLRIANVAFAGGTEVGRNRNAFDRL